MQFVQRELQKKENNQILNSLTVQLLLSLINRAVASLFSLGKSSNQVLTLRIRLNKYLIQKENGYFGSLYKECNSDLL